MAARIKRGQGIELEVKEMKGASDTVKRYALWYELRVSQ